MSVPEPSVPQIVKTIKALIDKGDHATDKAEQFYKSAGAYLKTLKARKPDDIPWYKFVRDKCNLSQQRADELIRITDGQTTLEKVRDDTKGRMQKLREQKPNPMSCDIGSEPAKTPAKAASEKKEEVETYRSAMLIHAESGIVYAEMVNASYQACPSALTPEIVDSARRAAKAWNVLTTKLGEGKCA